MFHLKPEQQPQAIALGAIVMTLIGVWTWVSQVNFVPCIADCGETFISQLYARNYQLFGFDYGLVEDHATSPDPAAHPYYYTHNVNIGGLSYLALEILGFKPFWVKQLVISLVFALGLFYIYRATEYHSGSRLFGLCALFLSCLDYGFFLSFSVHPLRVWNWFVIFGLLFHVGRFVLGERSSRAIDLLAIGILGVIGFGVGYEFWIISIFISLAVLVTCSRDTMISFKGLLEVTILMSLFFIPFFLRQIHIAYIMGMEYWAADFYYSFVIKIPFVSHFLPLPTMEEINQFYLSLNVMRPPSSPISSLSMFLDWFSYIENSVKATILPSVGLLGFSLTLVICLGSVIFLFAEKIRDMAVSLVKDKPIISESAYLGVSNNLPHSLGVINLLSSMKMIAALTIGILVGGTVLLPLIVPIYLNLGFPLIGALFSLAKGLVLALLVEGGYRNWKLTPRLSQFCLVLGILVVLDHCIVQVGNVRATQAMDTSWISTVMKRPKATYAVSFIAPAAAGFNQNWVVGIRPGSERVIFNRLDQGRAPFTKQDLFWFGERDAEAKGWPYLQPDYWLYFVTDRKTPMFDPTGKCRTDYLSKIWSEIHVGSVKEDLLFEKTWVRNSTVAPGDMVQVGAKISQKATFDQIELEFEGMEAQNLFYNCIHQIATVNFIVPQDMPPGLHFMNLIVKSKGIPDRMISLGHITIDPSASPTLVAAPSERQFEVNEVLRAYPNLSIADSRITSNPWDGYLLIDLREAYTQDKITSGRITMLKESVGEEDPQLLH